MEATIRLRPATPADAVALHEIQELSAGAANWLEEDYRESLSREGTLCLVAEDFRANQAVGFLLARTIADEMEVLNLAVIPDCRRRGLARRLLDEALARAPGVKQCWLEVRASNHAARETYRAAGFEEVCRRLGYYPNPVEDAVVYRRWVEAAGVAVLPSRRNAGEEDRS